MGIFGRIFGSSAAKKKAETLRAKAGQKLGDDFQGRAGKAFAARPPRKGHTGNSIIDPELRGDELEGSDVELFLLGELALFADSTHHAWAKYYPQEGALEFGFHDGRRGKASPISLREAESYAAASSKGTWFWDNVRVRGTMLLRKNWAYT